MDKYILVFGGCSWDATYTEEKGYDIPKVEMPGGKGANQAVAAARAGYKVKMISIVGDDMEGRKIVENLKDNGVDTTLVDVIPNKKSDSCKIYVSNDGGNDIKRSREAIDEFNVGMVAKYADVIKNAEMVITQSKLPKDVYTALINFCYDNGVKVVLTPCPSKDLKFNENNNGELLKKVTYITANEDESLEISCEATLQDALQKLPNLIATAGADGVYFVNNGEVVNVPALTPRELVDTTGAGDTFCGNFAVAVLKGYSKVDAVKRGVKASTLKLEKYGAQPGMPYAKDLDKSCEK